MNFKDRVLKLHLLGFDPSEIATTLTLDTKRNVSVEEVLEVLNELRSTLAVLPSLDDIRSEVGEALERARVFQKDLLAVYQNMLRNYNAMLEGLTEHPDGSPVIPVRPSDIASMADRIMKIDQERVTALLNTLKVMNTLQPPTNAPALPAHLDVDELVVEVESVAAET